MNPIAGINLIRTSRARLPFILTLVCLTLGGCVTQYLENDLNNTVTPIVAEANAAATAAESCTDPALQAAATTAATNARQAASALRAAGGQLLQTREQLRLSTELRIAIESNIQKLQNQVTNSSARVNSLLASAANPQPGIVEESRRASERAAANAASAVQSIATLAASQNVIDHATDSEKAELATLKSEAEAFAATAAAEAPLSTIAAGENDEHAKKAMTAGYLAEVRQERASIIEANIKIRQETAKLQRQLDVNVPGSEAAAAAAYEKALADFESAKAAANTATDAATAIATQCGCVVGPPQFPTTPYYNATWWDTASP